MRALLSKAGRAFLRAFGVGIITYTTGILAAPNLDQAYALGVAALTASLSAGFSAIQVFIPQITFGGRYGEYVNEFVRSSLGSFVVSVVGILNAPNLAFDRSVALAAITGALAAGVRALQGILTKGETPLSGKGF
jgi:hypothetical protein